MPHLIDKRKFLALSAAMACSPAALAQTSAFPSRPIRILVGFGAGGAADVLIRVIAKDLGEVLNTPVIIDNKPGAFQLMAINPLLASAPDGYTLFFGAASSLASGPGVKKDLPYDPLKNFTLLSRVATAPGVFFVHPDLPIQSMADLVRYAKANPGKLNYGSAGMGSSNHLQTEYLKKASGIDLVHVPFKSDQDVVREVAAGNIQFALTVAQAAIPLAQSGKIRPLAVTGAKRLAALPQVRTMKETGVAELESIDSYTFYGMVGPAGMPPAIVGRLNEAINKVLVRPAVAQRLQESMFLDVVTESPAQFGAYLEKEMVKWKELGKTLSL